MANPNLKAEKINVTLKVTAQRWTVKIDKIGGWIKPAAEEIVWVCSNADLDVTFDKNGCPFTSNHFFGPAGTDLCATGEPVNTTKRAYGYTLVITPVPPIQHGSVGWMGPIVFDPEVIVSSDGPPGGGSSKKSAKKQAKKKSSKKGARKVARKAK